MGSENIQKVDVAIIGAGWYGLVAARTYLKLRPTTNILIIDSDSTVGGVWSKERLYPNLVAQVRLGLFNYSDQPMPPYEGNKNDPRVTGEMIHGYLHRYAEDHDLLRRIRFNTWVTNADPFPGGWKLRLRDSSVIIEAKKLLVATGVTSIPSVPQGLIDNGQAWPTPTIHSRDFGKSYERLAADEVQNVTVVGAAKSAYDAVYLLLTMGKKVNWVIRSDGAGPLAILPFAILGLVNSIAFASTRLMTHLSPSILNTHGALYWFFQRSPLGLWLTGAFWYFLDYVSAVHAGYSNGDHVVRLKPEISRQSVFWAHSGLGVVTLPDFWNTLHGQNLTIIRDEVKHVGDHVVHLKSNRSLACDYLLFCTGWSDHFGIFNTKLKGQIGLPAYGPDLYPPAAVPREKPDLIDWRLHDAAAERELDEKLPFLSRSPTLRYPDRMDISLQRKWRLYRRVIPLELAAKGDRSLAILGQIHTVQTPLVAEVQTFWAILYLLGEVQVPDVETMAKEVSLWNSWTRRRYLNQGQKFPYSLYDFLPYIDTLFRDLGLNSRRKPNIIRELLAPYHPHDFNGFISEYMEIKKKSSKAEV